MRRRGEASWKVSGRERYCEEEGGGEDIKKEKGVGSGVIKEGEECEEKST